jgi:hypothetical protein
MGGATPSLARFSEFFRDGLLKPSIIDYTGAEQLE